MQSAQAILKRLHIVHLLTFADLPSVHQSLEEFQQSLSTNEKKSPSRFYRHLAQDADIEIWFRVEAVHDIASVLIQFLVPGEHNLERAAELCELSVNDSLGLDDQMLGATRLIMARCDDPVDDVARGLIGAVCGNEANVTRAGAFTEHSRLYQSHDLSWLFVLVKDDDDAEDGAAREVYGNLRVIETCFHKILRQESAYEQLRCQLENSGETLQGSIDELTRRIEAWSPENSRISLRSCLEESSAMTNAYLELTEAVGRSKQMLVSLEANLATMNAYFGLLPAGPEADVLRLRHDRAQIAIQQVKTDLGYRQPLLNLGQWLSGFYQNWLLTALNIAEAQENELRQAESLQRERASFNIACFAVWLGAVQIWAAAVASHVNDDSTMPSTFLLMATPAALGGCALWFLTRLFRRHGSD